MRHLRATLAALALLVPLAAHAQTAPTYVAPQGATPATSEATPPAGLPAVTQATPSTSSKAPTPSQPATRGTSTAGTGAKKSQQKVSTQLIANTPLQGDTTSVNARLPGLTTQPKLADIGDKLNQVVITGTPTVSNGRVSIDWTTVGRSDTGQIVTLPAPLASGLRTNAQALPAKTKIIAKGNADELYEAIRTLFSQQPASAGLANANGSASKSGSASTPTASGQQNTSGDVKALQSKAAESSTSDDEETTVSVETTTEGCELRIDLSQGYVIQQESTITIVNGEQDRGPCEDGATRYPIKKTGLGCTDEVRDTEAQGMTRIYYINGQGEEMHVQDCNLDNELIYPIVDENGSCPMFTDADARRVFDQAERVYRNNMNVRIVVADCAPTGDGYALETTAEGCSFRDDFTAGQSIQQIRDFYVKNGTMFYTGACYDADQTYAHQYEECSMEVDIPAGMAYTARRVYIDGPTGKQYRSECAPYGSGSAILATTDGCQSIHYDYPASESSRGAERLYYMAGGMRQYVTQCQESTAVYNWSYETTGYQNNDEARTSTEILAANITLPDVGVVQVSAPTVREASAIIPYVYEATQTLPNGEPKTYIGCNAYIPTDEMHVYRRADSTTYTYKVGPGTPSGPVDECTRLEETEIKFSHACTGTVATCDPKLAGPLGNTYSGNESCGIASKTTGKNWNVQNKRVVTTYPAGAGGGTTTSDWAFYSYLYHSDWSNTKYYSGNQGTCKD